MSRRRTAAAVSYAADGGRLIGDDAAAAATRRPATTVVRLRPLLGVNASDVAPNPSNAALTIKPFGERGSAGVSVRPKTVVPAEELAASLLHHARRLAEATLGDGARVRDAVVTVPPGAPPALRAALADAAAATNLTLLTLVSSPAAAALAYGIERKWAPTATRVLFYEQGSTRTAAALVDFRSTGGPAGAGSFAIVDVAWADLGSDALDGLLFERAADAFAAAHPSAPSIRADPRAAARLRVAVRRTKEILSANADAPVSVEEVVGGIDLRLTITRAELEADAAAAGFFDAAVAPVATLLKEHKVKPAALAAVELVGGGTRVPGLQAALVKVLGGRKLDR
jgi:hypoxia up-regulated 1